MADLGQGKNVVFTKEVELALRTLDKGILRVNPGNEGTGIITAVRDLVTADFDTGVISDSGALGSSTTTLVTQRAIKEYVDNVVSLGLSWRPAVDLHDSTQTDAGTNIVGQTTYDADGVTLANGDRLLLTAEATAPATYLDRVFLVSGVGSAIVLTLETDGQAGDGDPSEGDTFYILDGVANGNVNLVYNGTDWVVGASLSGALVKTNNLSDVSDTDTARANLKIQTISPSTVDVVAANGIVAVDKETLIVQSSTAGDCDISSDPQIVDGVDGQHLYLMGADNTKTVTLDNGTGLVLNTGQSFTLGANDTIHLVYNGTDWVEVTRSDNGT